MPQFDKLQGNVTSLKNTSKGFVDVHADCGCSNGTGSVLPPLSEYSVHTRVRMASGQGGGWQGLIVTQYTNSSLHTCGSDTYMPIDGSGGIITITSVNTDCIA